jgi:hypothetical protein
MQKEEKKEEPVLTGELAGILREPALTEKIEPTLSDIVTILNEGFEALNDVLTDMHNSLTIIERKLPEKPGT